MESCHFVQVEKGRMVHRFMLGRVTVQYLIILMMMLSTIHFSMVLFRSDCQANHMVGVGRLDAISIVVPYAAWNRSTVLESVQRWVAIGSPCKQDRYGSRHSLGDVHLIFYVNTVVKAEDRKMVDLAVRCLGTYASCFSQILVIGADLESEEDTYPAGPSNMFFKVFHDPRLQSEFYSSGHMFWMEQDVYPLRPGWVDFLLREAAKGDFWISGSVYLGEGLNDAVAVPDNWNWVGHINGNALYNLRDEAFREFLRLVVQYEPPNHFWKPFDVSIWRVVHAFPYTWPLYQKYRSKFVHSDFINHWGFHITSQDLNFSSAQQDVYFVHGTTLSAGNLLLRPKLVPEGVIWTDRVSKSSRLSIFISGLTVHSEFVIESAMSVINSVPDALEVVIIVRDSDVSRFEQHFDSNEQVQVVVENFTSADEQLRNTWSNLHADKYCTGDMILHIDADAVLNRELQLRDLLWLGKPILVYQRSDKSEVSQLKAIQTSHALGIPIVHDFTRSPLRIYPRRLYVHARNKMESVMKKNMTEIFMTLMNGHFNEFDYLGAYAFNYAHDAVALVPLESEERRKLLLPPPVIQSPLCKGVSKLANTQEQVTTLLQSLHDVWKGGLPCHRVLKLG